MGAGKKLRRERVDPGEWFDPVEIANARSYNRTRQRQAIGYMAVFTLCVAGSLVARLPDRLISAAGTQPWVLQVLLVALSVCVPFTVLSLPIDLARNRHESAWGVLPRKGFWRDAGEDLLLGVIAAPLLVLALWSLVRLSGLWWLALSLPTFVIPVLAGVALARSRKLRKVEDEHLVDRIRRVAREAGTTVLDVYVVPSKADPRSPDNYIAGLGRSARLVLSQDVLDRPTKEIEVLLARRISAMKYRLRGRLRFLLLHGVATPLAFLPAHLAISSAWVQRWLGIGARHDPRAIPLFLLVLVPSFFLLTTLTAWRSRVANRKMDADALDFTRDADAFESVVRTFHAKLMTDLAPSFYQRIRSDLPPPAERLAMAARWREARRLAVLFTDIESSTTLIERLGDDAWYELLQDHNEILRTQIELHGGTEVDSAGDGFFFVFNDAGEALLCAIEIQRRLARYSDVKADPLRVRMGVHTGEVIRTGAGVVGREVHLAARVASSASGGQILVSGDVHDMLSPAGRFRFREKQEVEFKGLSGTHRVYDVGWAEETTAGAAREAVASP